jgi:capsular polysaccharide biosynthesis protein
MSNAMSDTSGPEGLQIVDYRGVLSRRWRLIVAATLIATLGAVGYYALAHKVYSATASVYVTANAGTANQVSNGRTTGAVDLDTEAQILQSVTVAQAAGKLMHATENAQQLISRVSVTVPANSQVLTISCRAGSAAGAATCAQSFAQAYLNYISARTTSVVRDQILVLQKRISAIQTNNAKLTIEIASLPSNSTQRATANQQLNSGNTQLGSLNGQVAQLTEQLANPAGGSIISYASPPTKPSSPKAAIVLPSGFVVGLLVGLVLAIIVDRRDRRIHTPKDVIQLGVPVLMSLPLKQFAPEMAIASPRSPVGREFAGLAHVLAGALGAGNHVVLVAGSSSGRGAGLVAANLAVALSRSRPEVTLVCADLEGSVIPDMFGLPSAPGLTDLLAEGALAGTVGRGLSTAPRLRVITPGSAASTEAGDLQQDAVDQLLAGLRKAASWVVVEAPPAMSSADVLTLAQSADAVVLVAEAPRARTDELAEAVNHLERTGATVLGAVLLRSPKVTAAGSAPARAPGSNVRLEHPMVSRSAADGDGVTDWSAADEAPTSIHGS